MKISIRRIVSGFGLLALLLCIPTKSLPIHAAFADEKPHTLSPTSVTSYTFSAHAGDSLSLIVRRALQLRGVTDQPSAMYCENTISSELGNVPLAIDQQVVITYTQLDMCTAAAKGLGAVQREAWQTYADKADFNVSSIKPINNSAQVVTPQTTLTNPTAEPTPTNSTTVSPPPSPLKNSVSITAPTVKKAATYWWYIGAAMLVVIYFILDGPLPHKSKHRK